MQQLGLPFPYTLKWRRLRDLLALATIFAYRSPEMR
jgi:hypothetical protein